jgi:hypothetical protein
MELATNVLLSEEIKQTMGILRRDQSRVEVPQYFGQVETPLPDVSLMFKRYLEKQRGSLFDGYFEKHSDSQLVCCRSADGVAVVFCPSDHTGVWAGLIIQGSLGKRTQQKLEGIAKDKGLI